MYNGLSQRTASGARVGIAYNIKPTNTVLRVSYARTLETPFNENLIIASTGCSNPRDRRPRAAAGLCLYVRTDSLRATAMNSTPASTSVREVLGGGRRVHLEVHAQRLRLRRARHHTDHVPDRMAQFQDSRICGARAACRTTTVSRHSWSCPALRRASSSASRRRSPSLPAARVFRIDHDEKFNQTTHLQYQPWKRGPWVGFNWRYDSGLVAGAVPCCAPTATCSLYNGGPATPVQRVSLVNTVTGLPLTLIRSFRPGSLATA